VEFGLEANLECCRLCLRGAGLAVGLGRRTEARGFSGRQGFLRLGGQRRDTVTVGVQLVGIDVEVGQVSGAEAGGQGDICGVAADGHENSSEAAVVVASVEINPFAVEEDLVPGAEVTGSAPRLTNVSYVACDVAGGNVVAAGEGDGQVLEVAANADALGEDVHSGLGGAGGVVIEGDALMYPVTDGDGALPAMRIGLEEIVGDGAELVDLAVAAGEEELEDVGGKVVDDGLVGVGVDRIGIGAGVDQVGSGQPEVSGRGDEAGTPVAEDVEVISRGNDGLGVIGG